MDTNDKVFGVLSYLGFLCLIPIFAGKTDFVKFHANQGLVLFIVEAILGTVCTIVGFIPVIGWLGGIVGALVSLASFVLAILGIVSVAQGEEKELPVIGSIKILK